MRYLGVGAGELEVKLGEGFLEGVELHAEHAAAQLRHAGVAGSQPQGFHNVTVSVLAS